MASLPAFHSFGQAATDEQGGSSKVSKIQSTIQGKAEEPTMAGEVGDDSLNGPSVQARQIIQGTNAFNHGASEVTQDDTLGEQPPQDTRVTKTAADGFNDCDQGSAINTSSAPVKQQPKIHISKTSGPVQDANLENYVKSIFTATKDGTDENSLDLPTVQAPQVPESSVSNAVVDGFGHDLKASSRREQDLHSQLAALNTKASRMPFNPEDPAVVQILQQISNLERQIHKLEYPPKQTKLESTSRPDLQIHAASLNTTQTIIYITRRLAQFLLPYTVPSVVLAFTLNLVFYPKSGNMSVSTACWYSVLAVLASSLFFLVSSVQITMMQKKGKFINKAQSDLSKLVAASYLYVLGSGGHTTEMISLIRLSHKPYRNTHRRYLITAGDDHSLNQAHSLEDELASRHPNGSAGTFDIVTVTRARSVHQSFITSIFTSLKSFSEIAKALNSIPMARFGQTSAKDFRSPQVIVTNGPGTGYIVGLVAFFLKVFHIAPRDRLKVVFMETWARTNVLGLTGKLFYWTHMADVFIVQSEGLAAAIKKPCIGNVNKKWADLVNASSKEVHDAENGLE